MWVALAFGCGVEGAVRTRHRRRMKRRSPRPEADGVGTTEPMIALLSFLRGPSGKTSSMRVMSFYVVFLVMTTWAWISIRKQELQPMSPELMGAVLVTMGIQVAHKTVEAPKGKANE